MNAKTLLIVTALIEMGTGVALLVVPSLIVDLLLGEGLTALPAIVVARIAGAALIAIAVACWFQRNGERRAQAGLVAGMLIYNFAVPVLLIQSWVVSSLAGLGLWPASVLHTALAIWCVVCLRPRLNHEG